MPGNAIDQAEGEELHAHERDDAPVDVRRGDRLRRDAAQVEEREAEGRREERGLHVHADHDPEPDRVDAELVATGPSSGSRMKAISKKSMKKPSTNTSRFTTTRNPSAPPGTSAKSCSTHRSPVDAAEDEREDGRADEDEHHEGGQLRRLVHGLAEERPGEPALARWRGRARPPRPSRRPRSAWRCPGRSFPRTRKMRTSGGTIASRACR